MEDQTLQAKIDMLEQRIMFLEKQSASSGEGGVASENDFSWPIQSLANAASATAGEGPFTPVYEEDEETGEPTEVVAGFENCYWMNGGVLVQMSDQELPGTDGFIALKCGATPSTSGTATLECYATLAALRSAQQDVAHFIVPLYIVSDSTIDLDMRRTPVVFAAEVLP